ncbi:MAG TPA: hypothetical protein VIM62_13095 [Acidobacteriaceae bacterium]
MILTLGDSVTWGQGLVDEHKFDRIYAAGRDLTRLAHSGAIVGTAADTSTESVHPEIPVPYPSIWQQMSSVGDWSEIDRVIVNGGINDVSVTRIVNPQKTTGTIAGLTLQFCMAEMSDLLTALAGKVKADARIGVVGYFPILSPRSFSQGSMSSAQEKQARMLMEMHGIATRSEAMGVTADARGLIERIVENSMTFWIASRDALKVAAANANGVAGREVCVYVEPPFTEANSLWADHPLLWELDLALNATDELRPLRDMECEKLYGDLAHLIPWAVCDRASVGHPNVEGAAKIAEALTAALG